jgi:hypothetical protein
MPVALRIVEGAPSVRSQGTKGDPISEFTSVAEEHPKILHARYDPQVGAPPICVDVLHQGRLDRIEATLEPPKGREKVKDVARMFELVLSLVQSDLRLGSGSVKLPLLGKVAPTGHRVCFEELIRLPQQPIGLRLLVLPRLEVELELKDVVETHAFPDEFEFVSTSLARPSMASRKPEAISRNALLAFRQDLGFVMGASFMTSS